jgi:hypothetical protein
VVYTCLIAEYSFPEYNFDHGRSMSEFVWSWLRPLTIATICNP